MEWKRKEWNGKERGNDFMESWRARDIGEEERKEEEVMSWRVMPWLKEDYKGGATERATGRLNRIETKWSHFDVIKMYLRR